MMNEASYNEDEYWVKKAQAGDQEALAFLFHKYHNLAFFIALKICHCDADAEDIVQESFIEIDRSIGKLNEPKFFKAWLNKIIFSKSTKLFRKNKDVSISDEDRSMMNQSVEERRYLLPNEEMKFQNDREVLLYFLDCLPDKLRTSLYLMYFEQMSVREIAMILDIPEGTVKSRVSSAKAALKAMILQYERNENVKLDFHCATLETALTLIMLKQYEQSVTTEQVKGVHGKNIFRNIPKAVIGVACVAILGIGMIASQMFQEDKPPQQDKKETETMTMQSYHTFDPVIFQGEVITTAREAYEALTATAHCRVEVEQVDEALKAEMANVYRSLKKTGGIYYEMICRRQYDDIFE